VSTDEGKVTLTYWKMGNITKHRCVEEIFESLTDISHISQKKWIPRQNIMYQQKM
jgi:hypothetical protein